MFHNRSNNSSEHLVNFPAADERMRLRIDSIDIVMEEEVLSQSGIVPGFILHYLLFLIHFPLLDRLPLLFLLRVGLFRISLFVGGSISSGSLLGWFFRLLRLTLECDLAFICH